MEQDSLLPSHVHGQPRISPFKGRQRARFSSVEAGWNHAMSRPTTREVALATTSFVWTRMKRHGRKERILLYHNWHILLFCTVFQYVHSIATNLAYVMHQPRAVLYDLGFAVIPAIEMQVLSEILFFILLFGTIFFAISPFFASFLYPPAPTPGIGEPRMQQTQTRRHHVKRQTAFYTAESLLADELCMPSKPFYTVLIISRFMAVLVMAQTLRIVCFLVTSLPGPNYHCRIGSPYYNPPDSVAEVLLRQDALFGCGDLVFSSHTIFITLCTLVYLKYGQHQVMKYCSVILCATFGCFVLAARKHYSLDVVVALYTVPLLWTVYDRYCPDFIPLELIQLEKLETSRRRARKSSSDVFPAPQISRSPQSNLKSLSSTLPYRHISQATA